MIDPVRLRDRQDRMRREQAQARKAIAPRPIKLVGERFGLLYVKRRLPEPDEHGNYFYVVLCDCGKEKTMRGDAVRSGAKSCGHLRGRRVDRTMELAHGERLTVLRTINKLRDAVLRGEKPAVRTALYQIVEVVGLGQ